MMTAGRTQDTSMQDYFTQICQHLDSRVTAPQQYTCWFAAEESDFVRFNRGAVRQAGNVCQRVLTLELIDGQRHAGSTTTLGGEPGQDIALIDKMLVQLGDHLRDLPEDPHLLLADEVRSTCQTGSSSLPSAAEMVDQILALGSAHDMVGILASGPMYRGFANTAGQRNWHQTDSFNFDYSLYGHGMGGDKAVKTSCAGQHWDRTQLEQGFHTAVERLALLALLPRRIPPGAYRAYLTPTAMWEIVGMLNWGGVSEKALRTRQSSLRRMRDEGLCLNPAISLSEHTAAGLAPGFQEAGFIKPAQVNLIESGRLTGSLVSPRSSREYGIAANGADASEAMASISMAAGELAMDDALAALDTGILVSNLWYLNYSDRANCRMTGMTRFATFWVEHGKIVAPLDVMRFDESLFRLFGDNLLALTRERELLIDNASYGARGADSALLPGALVKDFNFVL